MRSLSYGKRDDQDPQRRSSSGPSANGKPSTALQPVTHFDQGHDQMPRHGCTLLKIHQNWARSSTFVDHSGPQCQAAFTLSTLRSFWNTSTWDHCLDTASCGSYWRWTLTPDSQRPSKILAFGILPEDHTGRAFLTNRIF